MPLGGLDRLGHSKCIKLSIASFTISCSCLIIHIITTAILLSLVASSYLGMVIPPFALLTACHCEQLPALAAMVCCLVCGSGTGGVWCAGQVQHGARDGPVLWGAVVLATTHYCQLYSIICVTPRSRIGLA